MDSLVRGCEVLGEACRIWWSICRLGREDGWRGGKRSEILFSVPCT